METWKLLVALTGMLLLYVLFATAMGREMTAVDLLIGVVFGGIGLYAGELLSNRLSSGEE